MKYAVANKNSVQCPDCKTQFEVSEDLYNAQVECPECKCQFKIEPPVKKKTGKLTDTEGTVRPVVDQQTPEDEGKTSSGIELADPDEMRERPMSTVRLSRNKNTMEQQRKNMPAPEEVDTGKLDKVVPVDNKVSCPGCKSEFEVAEEFYGSAAVCPDCEKEFLIAQPSAGKAKQGPGTKMEQYSSIRVRSASGPDPATSAEYKTSANKRRPQRGVISKDDDGQTTSGIEISPQDELAPARYQATATVRLSRNMTMQQKEKARQAMAPPPPPEKVARLPEVYPRNDEVACPGCKENFEISADYYGAVAECPECEAEFLIKAPRSSKSASKEASQPKATKPAETPAATAKPDAKPTAKPDAKPTAKASPPKAAKATSKPAAKATGKKKSSTPMEVKAEPATAKKASAATGSKKQKAKRTGKAATSDQAASKKFQLSPGMIVGGLIGLGVIVAAAIVVIALMLN